MDALPVCCLGVLFGRAGSLPPLARKSSGIRCGSGGKPPRYDKKRQVSFDTCRFRIY